MFRNIGQSHLKKYVDGCAKYKQINFLIQDAMRKLFFGQY